MTARERERERGGTQRDREREIEREREGSPVISHWVGNTCFFFNNSIDLTSYCL